jgi:plastocyanin
MRNIGMVLGGIVLLVTVGCAGASASAPVPESSRTGMVTEVKIGEVLTPKVSNAKTDDEVRWINATNSPVHIVLKKPMSALLSCLKGFVPNEGFEFVGSPDPNSLLGATVNTNEHASLCFSHSGIYEYKVKGTELEGTVMVK